MQTLIRQNIYGLLLVLALLIITTFQLTRNYDSLYIDTDIARDMGEMSSILVGEHRLLGPILGPGLQASGVYYYLYIPGLILSGQNPYSLIVTNQIIALVSLVVFAIAYHLFIDRKSSAIVAGLIGFTPWFLSARIHPGNGFTYVFFVLISLALSFNRIRHPISTGLSLGMGIALHPASLPLLVYHMWQLGQLRANKALSFLKYFIGLAIPSMPLILFELRHGFIIIRRFISFSSDSALYLHSNLSNIESVAHLNGLPTWVMIVATIPICYFVYKIRCTSQAAKLFSVSILTLLPLILLPTLPKRYLFVVAAMWLTSTIWILIKSRYKAYAKIGLTVWLIALLLKSPVVSQENSSIRSFDTISNTTNELIEGRILDPDKTYAVLSVLTNPPFVPQADDYRFLLRKHGYRVVDTKDISKADRLIVFGEVKDFDYINWTSWETEQFGDKKLIRSDYLNSTQIMEFAKEND